ncbi:hypothetical protein GGH99_000444 [Coemansia sp. RSA 1285]|nr:hypothetical protein GGH99_000444 [Coemansia sp. RSA 1285]
MSLFLDVRADIVNIFDPAKVPGSSVYTASNGTDLGMQAIFAGSFFLVFILTFSALRQRWPFIFSPRTRLTITAPPILPRRFFGWILPTLKTPETHVLNALGLDAVVFLRFYKMCMRLLLDISLFSLAIIWPINIRWSKINLRPAEAAAASGGDTGGGSGNVNLPISYSVTDYLFNLTLNPSDPKQKWNLVTHIVFVYVFSGIAYYHVSKFSSRWASLRWHFLMQSRHAMVSRTVMLTGVPRHLAANPRELEWFWGEGLALGKVERVRVCPFNTRLTSGARERARFLVRLEHAYARLLGNPCIHPDYDPARLRSLALDPSEGARDAERVLLTQWAGRRARPTVWVRRSSTLLMPLPWRRADAIDHWRSRFLKADEDFRRLRQSLTDGNGGNSAAASPGLSTTAFVTFEDAATAHMVTQLSCYPNPGYMKAKLAPEPRGVYWPNIWHSSRRKWLGVLVKWVCIVVIWAFWSVPVVLVSSLLTPESLGRVFPAVNDAQKHGLLRSFLSTTVPSVFLLLFLNTLPWILKQVHFATGERTKPDTDYSVMTKMWAFLVFNVVLLFGFSGTFWAMLLDVVNRPGTPMQSLASNIPRVGTFFTGYILVLGVGYQPFKLLQLRPVIWHIGRQWLCGTPRDYARLVAPVYIDWYSVYPYPLLVFTIAMVYSSFSPPVVVGAVVYYAIGYPVMKYLLLYVYFRPFETAGMAWPKVCRRMILAVILYQVVMLAFVVVKGGGWYTFSLVPVILAYLWFFYHVGWSLEKQGTVLPVYLWRNPPPDSSYPMPPSAAASSAEKQPDGFDAPASSVPAARSVANNTARIILGSRMHRRRCRPAASSVSMRGSAASSSRRTARLAQAEKKRLRYKCLAEVATAHGSKLIRSLSRNPATATAATKTTRETTSRRWRDSGVIEEEEVLSADENEWEDDAGDAGKQEVDEEAGWDPLLYLRPSGAGDKKQQQHQQHPSLLMSEIIQRPPRESTHASTFASGVVQASGSGTPLPTAAASAAEAEPTLHSASPLRIASRLQGTLHNVRDYFLADFRPACPILDLTYDRAYSQGTDAESAGATLTPFRQLLGRVLPRALSPGASRRGTAGLSLHGTWTPELPLQLPQAQQLLSSRLNYTPSRSQAPESDAEQLLLANYQRYAVEAQSTFAPDQHTDYTQTPMLNFQGILDRGIQDYVHPGLVGELPTLWLPARKLHNTGPLGNNDEDPAEASPAEVSADAAHMLVSLPASRWWIGRWLFRQYRAEGRQNSSNRYSQELREVQVHRTQSASSIY